MAPANGKTFVEGAIIDGIPRLAVLLKCRNWGIPSNRAADIAEEASAEAYQRSLGQRFNDSAHYRAWVTRTAINVAIDLLRQQARFVSCHWLAELGCDPQRRNELKDVLADALEALTDRQRLLLSLTYDVGLTLDEIAERLLPNVGGSPNAKRLRIKRERDEALTSVRAFLAQHGFPSGNHAAKPAANQSKQQVPVLT